MPATPWKRLGRPDPDREYLALLSVLPLRRYTRVPAFLRDTARIAAQIERTPGVLGYSLHAQPLRARFRTLSVWESETALDAFVRASPHRQAMAALRPHMGPTRFVRWAIRGAAIPPTWAEARRREALA
jgi:quinol monooxygenase YgiN